MSNLAPKPKVVAAVIGGIVASALLSNLTLITPDLFDGLGKFSGLVYGLTITLVIGVCGWLKTDATASAGTPAPSTPAPTDKPAEPSAAPASTYPAAAVASAEAAPVEVTPIIPA